MLAHGRVSALRILETNNEIESIGVIDPQIPSARQIPASSRAGLSASSIAGVVSENRLVDFC